MKAIHIFRSGTHTDSAGNRHEFAGEVLRQIAESYQPDKSEAPLVVGHPQTNDPAYGWVERLEYRSGEDDEESEGLWAYPHQVAEEFDEVVEAGRFKKRSASFFGPDHPSNPTPGQHYLRHVGFLGGAAPAVKGLKELGFADEDENIVEFAVPAYSITTIASIFRSFREWLIADRDMQTADQVVPSYAIDELESQARRALDDEAKELTPAGFTEPEPPTEDTSMTITAEELAALQAEHEQAAQRLKADQEAFAAQQAEFAAQQQQAEAEAEATRQAMRTARHDAHRARATSLVASGQLVADHVERLTAICDSIAVDATFEFAEGDETKTIGVVDAVFDLLAKQPRRGPDVTEYSASDVNGALSGSDAEIGKKIAEYRAAEVAKGRTLSFADARKELVQQH